MAFCSLLAPSSSWWDLFSHGSLKQLLKSNGSQAGSSSPVFSSACSSFASAAGRKKARYYIILIILVGMILDIPGNPIFNAPYEALFLEPGQQLQGSATVETIGGETHVSGSATVVDADGSYVSTPNGFLMAFYRALIYFGFYSVLLTISGLLPNRRRKGTAGANAHDRNRQSTSRAANRISRRFRLR